jgi:hypothetical protein
VARDFLAESDLLRRILKAAHSHHSPIGTGLAVFDGKLYVSSIVPAITEDEKKLMETIADEEFPREP